MVRRAFLVLVSILISITCFAQDSKQQLNDQFWEAVRKGDLEFIKWVNEQLAKIKKDGTYDKLWKKYFGEVEANLFKP